MGINPNVVPGGAGQDVANDVWLFRAVVGTLGLVAIIGLVGLIVLNFSGKTSVDAIVALASAAVGALAGPLAPSPASQH